ncbi:MAG: non-ribosomal peptide synthetase, partial [Tumebacillaceae bacterium]
TFGVVNGQPMQIINPSLTLTLPMTDLSHVPEAVREQTVAEAMQAETKTAFDLAEGPLIRASLLKVSDEEHVLLLSMHHIISDGWSMNVFLRDLAVSYEAHLTEASSTQAPLTLQYADFAAWQREWLESGVLEQQLGYWREKLGGRLPLLQLPTDRQRQKVQSTNGAALRVQFSQALTEQLKQLSRQEEATLFMTLLAAYKTLLYRYTGQEDIIVGTPIAGRTREEIESMIGFFVNSLVLRTEVLDDLPFRDLLHRVRDVAFEAYAHQDVPFEKLVEALQPERDLSYTPFFQTMFILQNTPMDGLQLPGLDLQPLPLTSTTSKFDITLSLTENEQGLGGTWEYNSDLFDATTIERMAQHFLNLLEGIVQEPDRTVGRLPLLTEQERHHLLYEKNDNAKDYDCTTLHQMFEQRVLEVPDLPAVYYEGQSLTYRELNARANQLAHRLQKLGISKGVMVGVSVDRSVEVLVAMLGALKSGGAFVTFDPTYPEERLAFMLDDSEAPVLLTLHHLLGKWEGVNAHVICLDTDWDDLADESTENPNVEVSSEDLAYMIYTSGTTGKPKASLAHHRGLINLLDAVHLMEPLMPGERNMTFVNFGFDVFVYEVFTGLLSGATTYVVPEEIRIDSESVFRYIEEHQLHGVFLPNALVKDLSNWIRKTKPTLCLHRLMLGAEPIHEQLLDELTRLLPDLHILYSYGPSEAAVMCTLYQVKNGSPTAHRNAPIGKAYSNVRLYLLDRHMQPVPIGVHGELYVGGHGVAYGYRKRPELSAERFVSDPFSGNPNDRLYRTGDIVHYLPDGNIEFIGRRDHQVKLRGFRIELGEIETHLQRHPAVRENVPVVREDVPGEKQLVCYVALYPGHEVPSTSDLRRFLQQSVPEYMIPSVFHFLDALPRTPNRKVDLHALPKPETFRPTLEVGYVAPQSAMEHELAAIWQELLRVERVGIHDNFFDLGGHSMLIVQMQRLIRERMGIELAVVQLFEYPMISALAGYLESGQESEQELIAVSQQRGDSRRETMKQRRQSRTNKRTARTKGEPLDE